MSQHTTSHTSTLTQLAIVPSHGKISAVTCSEAMDVDQDGLRLADRNDNKDIMDTTLEGAQDETPKSRAPEESVTGTEVPAAAEEAEAVLDRPRDGEAQQSSSPMRKIPH